MSAEGQVGRSQPVRSPIWNLGWSFGGIAVSVAAGFASSAVLARILPPAEFGKYLFTISFVTLIGSVTKLGLRNAIVRIVAEDCAHGLQTHIWGRVVAAARLLTVTAIASAALIALATQVLGPSIGPLDGYGIVLAVVLLGAENYRAVLPEIFRGLGSVALATIFGEGTRNLLVLLAVLTLPIVSGVDAVAVMAGVGLALAVLAIPLLARGAQRRDSDGVTRWRQLVSVALPVMVGGIGTIALGHGFVWVAGFGLSAEDVGAYGAAFRVVTTFSLALLVVEHAVAPDLVRHRAAENWPAVESTLRRASFITLSTMMIPVLVVCIWPSRVLQIIFGGGYESASPALQVLVLAQLVNGLTGICGAALILLGFERDVIRASWPTALFGLALGASAAMAGSMMLLALANAAALAIYNLTMVRLLFRRTGLTGITLLRRRYPVATAH